VRNSRTQAKKPSVPKRVTSFEVKTQKSSDCNSSSDSARPLSAKRPASSSSTSSKRSTETKENSSSSSTSRTRTRTSHRAAISSVSKKKGSPIGARKQRPKTLSNMTNSAKKRKTTSRQNIAKDVTARLEAIEKLQNVAIEKFQTVL
jgi:hypothetical protein